MEPFHIVIEKNVPFAKGLFDNVADVSYVPASEITAEVMHDADALITRTRTRCDENLLGASRCRIVASATIGLDHVDLKWCADHGITVKNAPGCNAPAVAQYVMSSIIAAYGQNLSGLSLGIVGVGHVGSIVDCWARQLGMRTLLVDPPRAESEGNSEFNTLDEAAEKADIITIHTPYTCNGPHATHHLVDSSFLHSLKRTPMLINSARGPVVDTDAIKEAIDSGFVGKVVMDCWENEPDIDRELLEKAFIATPHIAGYSREGKIRATAMAVHAVASALGLPCPTLNEKTTPGAAANVTAEAIARSYDPLEDTRILRATPADFERLRNNYPLRHEVTDAE